jgi:hypothetical protein
MQRHLCILSLGLGRHVGLITNITVLGLYLILTNVVISSAISTSRAIKEWNLLTTEYRNIAGGTSAWDKL